MKKICPVCNEEFVNEKKVIYCSQECYIKFRQWRKVAEGKADYRTVKRFLLRTQGNRCSSCDLTEWKGQPIALVLDHQDGNYNNNSLENCRLLCNNCDAQTSTYKGRNKGNGRYARRIRYKKHKSY